MAWNATPTKSAKSATTKPTRPKPTSPAPNRKSKRPADMLADDERAADERDKRAAAARAAEDHIAADEATGERVAAGPPDLSLLFALGKVCGTFYELAAWRARARKPVDTKALSDILSLDPSPRSSPRPTPDPDPSNVATVVDRGFGFVLDRPKWRAAALARMRAGTVSGDELHAMLLRDILDSGRSWRIRAGESLMTGGAGAMDSELSPNAAGQPRSVEVDLLLGDADAILARVLIAKGGPRVSIDRHAEAMARLRERFREIHNELGVVMRKSGQAKSAGSKGASTGDKGRGLRPTMKMLANAVPIHVSTVGRIRESAGIVVDEKQRNRRHSEQEVDQMIAEVRLGNYQRPAKIAAEWKQWGSPTV